jgi:excisionase family DNA binding protein
MPLERNGEVYVTASEAAKYLGVSRETFYNNVQPQLQQYQLGALKRLYYRRSDLDRFKDVRPVDREDR